MIASAEIIVDNDYFDQRARCPLCRDSSSSPYSEGFSVPEGLRRHLIGWGNARQCSVMEAACALARDHWHQAYDASDRAEDNAKQAELEARRKSETLFQVAPDQRAQSWSMRALGSDTLRGLTRSSRGRSNGSRISARDSFGGSRTVIYPQRRGVRYVRGPSILQAHRLYCAHGTANTTRASQRRTACVSWPVLPHGQLEKGSSRKIRGSPGRCRRTTCLGKRAAHRGRLRLASTREARLNHCGRADGGSKRALAAASGAIGPRRWSLPRGLVRYLVRFTSRADSPGCAIAAVAT